MNVYMHRLVLTEGKLKNEDLRMSMDELKEEIKNGWTTDLDIATKEKSNFVVRFLNGTKNDCRKENLQRIYIKK